MYAKIFAQIFDSSIAENYEVRHVFEDLLKLADIEGVVDMTPEAIHRRTNVPLEKVLFGLQELAKPDSRSRSKEHEGRRIIPVDSNRDWGWIIVNYKHYRYLMDEEARRSYFRDAKRKQRQTKPGGKRVSRPTPVAKNTLPAVPCTPNADPAAGDGNYGKNDREDKAEAAKERERQSQAHNESPTF